MKSGDVRAGEPFGGLDNPTGWYRHYCLLLVFVVLVLANADRGILNIIVETVRKEFGLSDTQLGLLIGPAFAIFYATLGLPMARWADMGDRRVVITASLAIWSLMTALGGLAHSFLWLFLTRIGVGIGEAGAFPPTHSLVANYYPSNQHGKVASVINFSTVVGSLVGIVLGSYLLVAFGWRVALMALGLPGLLLAVLTFTTLKEPRRITRVPRVNELFSAESLATIAALFRKKTFVQLTLGFTIVAFLSYGTGAFTMAFFVRSFGLNEAQIGAQYGPVYALSSILGTVLAAISIDWLQRRDVRWLLRFPGICCGLVFPFWAGMYLAPTFSQALSFAFVGATLLAMTGPAVFAGLYGIIRPERRATALAVALLAANLLGLGVGPVAVGATSDALGYVFGEESLRYALALFTVLALWSAWHFYRGAKTIADDYEGTRPDAGEPVGEILEARP